MSQATKKKHVAKEVLESYILPQEDQTIVKVIAGRGNNLHEVQTPEGEQFLASMPTKFRKSVWIKRGDFVIVTPIEEGDKVKAEILHILLKEQIKYIQSEGKWPEAFTDVVKSKEEDVLDDEDSDLIANPNHVMMNDESDESQTSSEDDEEEED